MKTPGRCRLRLRHCVGPDRAVTNRCTEYRCWACLVARTEAVAKRAGVWSGALLALLIAGCGAETGQAPCELQSRMPYDAPQWAVYSCPAGSTPEDHEPCARESSDGETEVWVCDRPGTGSVKAAYP